MSTDYFTILGLAPGRYRPTEIEQRFQAVRARCMAALHEPAQHAAIRERLELVHRAYRTLVDPERQREYLARPDDTLEPADRMRRLIAASLEGDLLRHSRRQEILERGRELGFNDFQTHLMIAQVQFGDTVISMPKPRVRTAARGTASQAGARLVAAGALATALFLLMRHYLVV